MSKLVSLARRLSRAKVRREEGLFKVEGLRSVETVLDYARAKAGDKTLETVLYLPEILESHRGRRIIESSREIGIEVQELRPDERDLFETENPQGILALVRRPLAGAESLAANPPEWVLLLDGVADPGNAGTLLRTASAAGLTTVILGENCVDITNPKVARSAVGELLRLRVIEDKNERIHAVLKEAGFRIAGVQKSGGDHRSFDYSGRLALILGSEGHGLSAFWQERLDESVGIEIAPEVESLNVAVAGGILLFEARNKRLRP